MRTNRFDYSIITNELKPPLGEKKFFSKVAIREIGVGDVVHNLGEVWGKTREEANSEMRTKAEQLIQVLEK